MLTLGHFTPVSRGKKISTGTWVIWLTTWALFLLLIQYIPHGRVSVCIGRGNGVCVGRTNVRGIEKAGRKQRRVGGRSRGYLNLLDRWPVQLQQLHTD